MSLFTKKFRSTIALSMSAVDMSRLNRRLSSRSVGQNHVLPRTSPVTRSGDRTAHARPIGPPQSCPMTTRSLRSSSAIKPDTTRACSAGVYP